MADPKPTTVLDRLVDIARQIESHRSAVYLLEQERSQLRMQLAGTEWKPPAVPELSR